VPGPPLHSSGRAFARPAANATPNASFTGCRRAPRSPTPRASNRAGVRLGPTWCEVQPEIVPATRQKNC
jgi:hypothetical protein